MSLAKLPEIPITIACAQAEPFKGDIAANVHLAAEMIADAGRAGAKIVLFPEKFLSGYEPDLIRSDPDKHTVTANDPRLQPIFDACQRHHITAIVGAAARDGGKLYISSLVVDSSGKLRGLYAKQFLFHSEKAIYEPGRTGIALDLGGWRFGLAICYDTGFPEHARAAALQGCHVYLASALFSKGNGFHESRTWFPARALDNTIFVALSNHVGITGGWTACGASAVWSPYGELLCNASADQSELVVATLEPEALRKVRQQETMLADLVGQLGSATIPYEVIRLDTNDD